MDNKDNNSDNKMSYMNSEISEENIIEKMMTLGKIFGRKFSFGYYDNDDISQEAIILGLEAYKKHDGSRPIQNFLYSHMRNRLCNLKRKKYKRAECPCRTCLIADEDSLTPPHIHSLIEDKKNKRRKYDDSGFCLRYLKWKKINQSKQGLMSPGPTCETSYTVDLDEKIDREEIMEKIDWLIPYNLRGIYLRYLAGAKIQPQQRKRLICTIQELLCLKSED